jgi:drug/metabolite transporter (DMT)-like permease
MGGVGWLLLSWAQSRVEVGLSSIVVTPGAAAITATGAWVFFDQAMRALQLVGAFGVVAGLYCVMRTHASRSDGAPF